MELENPLEAYQKTRNAFKAVVVWMNQEKPQLSEHGRQALKDLHACWKAASLQSTLHDFWEMKQYHTIISTELESEVWKVYLDASIKFRLTLMRASE